MSRNDLYLLNEHALENKWTVEQLKKVAAIPHQPEFDSKDIDPDLPVSTLLVIVYRSMYMYIPCVLYYVRMHTEIYCIMSVFKCAGYHTCGLSVSML